VTEKLVFFGDATPPGGLPVEGAKKRKKPPSVSTMQRWMDGGWARATDGCVVEPDGACPHGKLSWLVVKGMI